MNKEIKYIVINMFKTINKSEKVWIHVFPIVVDCIIIFSFSLHAKLCSNALSRLDAILSDYITIFTLFVSFTIGYLTMLITSNGYSINLLKSKMSKNFFSDIAGEKPYSLYQILMSHITYTVLIELIALILCVIGRFMYMLEFRTTFKIVFFVITALFVYIILLLFRIIKNIYLSFWKDKKIENDR